MPWTHGKPSANHVCTDTPLFAALRTGESNNLKESIVDRYGVLSCGRLLDERTNSLDLACSVPLIDSKSERIFRPVKVRRLRT